MSKALTEQEDFYFNEQGLVVLTKSYHLKKGYCCGNGCTHCPYNFINVPEPKRSELLSTVNDGSQKNNSSKN